METKYRANRRAFYMTYAKSGDLTAEQILEHMESIGEVDKYLIARELHEDGTPHHHAYIVFKKKHNFTSCRWADVGEHHPSDHGAVRDAYGVIRYCTKEATETNRNYITNFYEQDPYALALACGDFKMAVDIVKAKRPRDYVLNCDKIEQCFKKQCTKSQPPRYTLDQFTRPPIEDDPIKCPVIYGVAECGKTQYAKAHFKNPLTLRHIDKLKQLNYPAIHDGIVFDEVGLSHWPPSSVIALFDKEEDTDINVKGSFVTIPAGCPRIFTINNINRLYPEGIVGEEVRGLERRMNQVYIGEDIRKK